MRRARLGLALLMILLLAPARPAAAQPEPGLSVTVESVELETPEALRQGRVEPGRNLTWLVEARARGSPGTLCVGGFEARFDVEARDAGVRASVEPATVKFDFPNGTGDGPAGQGNALVRAHVNAFAGLEAAAYVPLRFSVFVHAGPGSGALACPVKPGSAAAYFQLEPGFRAGLEARIRDPRDAARVVVEVRSLANADSVVRVHHGLGDGRWSTGHRTVALDSPSLYHMRDRATVEYAAEQLPLAWDGRFRLTQFPNDQEGTPAALEHVLEVPTGAAARAERALPARESVPGPGWAASLPGILGVVAALGTARRARAGA